MSPRVAPYGIRRPARNTDSNDTRRPPGVAPAATRDARDSGSHAARSAAGRWDGASRGRARPAGPARAPCTTSGYGARSSLTASRPQRLQPRRRGRSGSMVVVSFQPLRDEFQRPRHVQSAVDAQGMRRRRAMVRWSTPIRVPLGGPAVSAAAGSGRRGASGSGGTHGASARRPSVRRRPPPRRAAASNPDVRSRPPRGRRRRTPRPGGGSAAARRSVPRRCGCAASLCLCWQRARYPGGGSGLCSYNERTTRTTLSRSSGTWKACRQTLCAIVRTRGGIRRNRRAAIAWVACQVARRHGPLHENGAALQMSISCAMVAQHRRCGSHRRIERWSCGPRPRDGPGG